MYKKEIATGEELKLIDWLKLFAPVTPFLRMGGMSQLALCPPGWEVASGGESGGESTFTSPTGHRLTSLSEVRTHLTSVGAVSGSLTPEEQLWLRTLRRYGENNCRHWAAAASAANIPECPTFRPTTDEFADPGRYIESIIPRMAAYGMCKIVPPEGWCPPPWSGRPPRGAPSTPIPGHDANVEDMCAALCGGEGDVHVQPRVQLMQRFNKVRISH